MTAFVVVIIILLCCFTVLVVIHVFTLILARQQNTGLHHGTSYTMECPSTIYHKEQKAFAEDNADEEVKIAFADKKGLMNARNSITEETRSHAGPAETIDNKEGEKQLARNTENSTCLKAAKKKSDTKDHVDSTKKTSKETEAKYVYITNETEKSNENEQMKVTTDNSNKRLDSTKSKDIQSKQEITEEKKGTQMPKNVDSVNKSSMEDSLTYLSIPNKLQPKNHEGMQKTILREVSNYIQGGGEQKDDCSLEGNGPNNETNAGSSQQVDSNEIQTQRNSDGKNKKSATIDVQREILAATKPENDNIIQQIPLKQESCSKEDENKKQMVEDIQCDQCKERIAIEEGIRICEECEETLCKSCEDLHRFLNATRSHKLIEITSETIKCNACFTQGEGNKEEAKNRCDFCKMDLCVTCTDTNTSDTSKPLSIVKLNEQERMSLTIKHLKHSIKIQKEKQEKKMKEPKQSVKMDQPGKPVAVKKCIESVSLIWDSPKQLFNDHSFKIRYKIIFVNGNSKWRNYDKQTDQFSIKVNGLKPETKYIFQVRMADNEGEGSYSEPSDVVCTEKSAAASLYAFTVQLNNTREALEIRQLSPIESNTHRNIRAKTRTLIYSGKKNPRTEKTIILLGATGSGKSTLIDGMINYIYGVSWADHFRFTIIDLEEEEKNKKSQAVSLTEWVTCYTIPPVKGSRLDYTLNIVDTPGFGDTRGIERDKEIVNQIRELFSGRNGVVFLDAVCFIIKAPDARLTASQRYIFESVMSLFGKDVEENICILITFADGQRPPVLSALEETDLSSKLYFKFNNSGLFAENTENDGSYMSALFWEMGINSFKSFFEHLNLSKSKSLRQTKQVLEERLKIEATIEDLEPLIQTGLNKIDQIKQETTIFENHESDIRQNKDFEYEVTETKMEPIPLEKGVSVTNCLHCHFTCHRRCAFSNDEDKAKCSAMNSSGFCEQCDGKCHWEIHRNTPFYYEPVEKVVKKKYQEKLDKYNKAKSDILSHSQLIEAMTSDLHYLEVTVVTLINTLNECNNRLKEIALRPNPLDTEGYIDMMIQSEEIEKRPGFLRRIESLRLYKKRLMVAGDAKKLMKEIAKRKKSEDFQRRAKSFIYWEV